MSTIRTCWRGVLTSEISRHSIVDRQGARRSHGVSVLTAIWILCRKVTVTTNRRWQNDPKSRQSTFCITRLHSRRVLHFAHRMTFSVHGVIISPSQFAFATSKVGRKMLIRKRDRPHTVNARKNCALIYSTYKSTYNNEETMVRMPKLDLMFLDFEPSEWTESGWQI